MALVAIPSVDSVMTDLSGKTALITGASRGIGATTARQLASLGARVVLAARGTAEVARIAQDITQSGGEALAVGCDVADVASVKALVSDTTAAFGSLDIVVNNAGLIDPISRIEDSDPEDWGHVIDVNLKGVYYMLRFALPVMKRQGSGTIINISSGAATGALEGWSHYCASKAGVLRLTGVAHKEHADDGIIVVGLSPGTVATEMQVKIKASGVNPVSQLDPGVHIPAAWVAQAIAHLCGPLGAEYAGTDFSMKTDEGRKRIGLPLVGQDRP